MQGLPQHRTPFPPLAPFLRVEKDVDMKSEYIDLTLPDNTTGWK
jgi:hypothetical protein